MIENRDDYRGIPQAEEHRNNMLWKPKQPLRRVAIYPCYHLLILVEIKLSGCPMIFNEGRLIKVPNIHNVTSIPTRPSSVHLYITDEECRLGFQSKITHLLCFITKTILKREAPHHASIILVQEHTSKSNINTRTFNLQSPFTVIILASPQIQRSTSSVRCNRAGVDARE